MSRRGRPSKPRGDEAVTAVRLPRDLHKKLRIAAVMEERSTSEIVKDALEQFMDFDAVPRSEATKEEPS